MWLPQKACAAACHMRKHLACQETGCPIIQVVIQIAVPNGWWRWRVENLSLVPVRSQQVAEGGEQQKHRGCGADHPTLREVPSADSDGTVRQRAARPGQEHRQHTVIERVCGEAPTTEERLRSNWEISVL
eukprot:scaffold116057_cov63-Phaeocystis_antarctica.AAC.3